MTGIPKTMRALIARRYCQPSDYEIGEVPVPTIDYPDDVLIKVHAATVQTGDTQVAGGKMRLFGKIQFPIKIGSNSSGTVVAVGKGVTAFKVGDEVYGTHFVPPVFPRTRDPGACAEYAVASEGMLLKKPPNVSFEDAASILGSAMTGLQSIRRGLELMGRPNGTLEDKTVFMPGGLSATGSIGAQLIKNVFGAKKLITTVSTTKVPLVEQHLPGVYDKVVDYKTQDVVQKVGPGTADFVYNTQWDLTGVLPIANPDHGVVVSIASIPPARLLSSVLGPEYVPFWVVWILGLVQMWYDWKQAGTNIKRDFVSGDLLNREDQKTVAKLVATGQIKALVSVVDFSDLNAVRQACMQVSTGKGGLGKLVLKIV
ncbi:hypothetical protein SBRCBS47491_006344 [Sporothrix bragantina]|uniref:Enoyl reductase (ER) domain-containing protein n=1 Tax=Sporothrix bragantina TaxID=671064 RepID=A0ABP0C6K4_9PEZI